MIDGDDDASSSSDEIEALAGLADEVSSRLEAGDSVNGTDLGADPGTARAIRRLLPTLRTMVAFGEQVAREEGSRTRLQRKNKSISSSSLYTSPEIEEIGP